jgi:hypothetical protein
LKRADSRRKWSTIPRVASAPTKQQHYTISRHASSRGGFLFHAALRLFELALVLVRLDHVTDRIVNANHSWLVSVSLCARLKRKQSSRSDRLPSATEKRLLWNVLQEFSA